jgi:hypothetical protein
VCCSLIGFVNALFHPFRAPMADCCGTTNITGIDWKSATKARYPFSGRANSRTFLDGRTDNHKLILKTIVKIHRDRSLKTIAIRRCLHCPIHTSRLKIIQIKMCLDCPTHMNRRYWSPLWPLQLPSPGRFS